MRSLFQSKLKEYPKEERKPEKIASNEKYGKVGSKF